MIKTKVAFLEGRLLPSQLEQSEKFLKSLIILEKSRPSKKPTFVLIVTIQSLQYNYNKLQALNHLPERDS